jgi:hypothetical protein
MNQGLLQVLGFVVTIWIGFGFRKWARSKGRSDAYGLWCLCPLAQARERIVTNKARDFNGQIFSVGPL